MCPSPLGKSVLDPFTDAERAQWAKALEESESRYRTLAAAVTDLVWTLQADFTPEYLSDRWLEYSGRSVDEIRQHGWGLVVHPDDLPRWRAEMGRAFERGGDCDVVFRLRRVDGAYRWMLGRAHPLRTDDGHIVKWIGTTTDIHERREALLALRESELRQRLALSAARAAGWEYDLEHDRPCWTPEMFELFGLSAGTPAPTLERFADLVHPDDRERTYAEFNSAIASGGSFSAEFRILKPGGAVAWIASMGVVELDAEGRAVRARGIDQDITQRKEVEQEKRLQADLLNQTRDAVLVWDFPGGPIRFWSRGAEDLYGYSREEALGRHPDDVVGRPEPSVSALETELARQGSWVGELVHRTKSNREITVDSRFALVRRHDGSALVMATNRDISERKHVEERLRENEQRLVRLYEEARAAIQARDHLASVVSHDLRNPLGSIATQTSLLIRQLESDRLDVAKLGPALARIERASTKMEHLIGDLLDMARLQAGQALALSRERVDLLKLVRRLADDQQRAAPAHVIRTRTCENGAVIGMWDARRLERLVDNLLTNAVKYSPSGSEVTVSVASSCERDREWAVLTVADRGFGIPERDIPYIFDWFARGENVAERIRGTGVGLAGARQIAEHHGGSIAVASTEGDGSTFTVKLPLHP